MALGMSTPRATGMPWKSLPVAIRRAATRGFALVSSHTWREKIGAWFWWQAVQTARWAYSTRGVPPAR